MSLALIGSAVIVIIVFLLDFFVLDQLPKRVDPRRPSFRVGHPIQQIVGCAALLSVFILIKNAHGFIFGVIAILVVAVLSFAISFLKTSFTTNKQSNSDTSLNRKQEAPYQPAQSQQSMGQPAATSHQDWQAQQQRQWQEQQERAKQQENWQQWQEQQAQSISGKTPQPPNAWAPQEPPNAIPNHPKPKQQDFNSGPVEIL